MPSPVVFCRVPGDGEGGEHDGQVRFDRVPGVVKHRSGSQVGLGHPASLLDVPQVEQRWLVMTSAAGISSAGMLVTYPFSPTSSGHERGRFRRGTGCRS